MDSAKFERVYYKLTHPQKRIWYMAKTYPDTALCTIGGWVRFKGRADFTALESCINLFVKTNAGARLRFTERDVQVRQYINNYEAKTFELFDFSIYEDPEAEFGEWVEKESKRPMALTGEDLCCFAMFKISAHDYGFLAKCHHIIADGWSMSILTSQICKMYGEILNGNPVNEEECYPYTEYIENERNYMNSKRFEKDRDYWRQRFVTLPQSFLGRVPQDISGRRKVCYLDEDISLRLRRFLAGYRYSLNTFFTALFLLYLHKTYREKDIVLGIPVFNRSGKKEKQMMGMFTSAMPFRFFVSPEYSFTDLLEQVNSQLRVGFIHQKYPYDLLVKDLAIKKQGYDNLFDICVNYYNTKLLREIAEIKVENREFYNGSQIYLLQLVIKEWDGEKIELDLDYRADAFSERRIEEMSRRLFYLIEQVLAEPKQRIGDLSVITEEEKQHLLGEYNRTQQTYPGNTPIYRLFEKQVESAPDKTAISFRDKYLSYRKLNEKANQVARLLRDRGVGKESIVGIMMEHSIEIVIAILGVLKAGGAFLPIEPKYPLHRISFMLEDSGTSLLLTNLEINENLSFPGEVLHLDNVVLDACHVYNGENLEFQNQPDDLAYVIYTSGSTGNPKGVLIEHRSLVNYIWWARQVYVHDEEESFPLYSSLAFDLTITSVFTPLISGGRIVVYRDDDEEEFVLYKIMREKRVSVIKLTPSHLTLLKGLSNNNSSIKRIIVGGEDLKTDLAHKIYRSFGGDIEIYNEYGPTETVVGCMIHKYDPKTDTGSSVPIGVPVANTQIYILDDQLNLLPSGTTGEIYICGDGVARAYLNSDDLTSERFIDNPFKPGRKMYKTGDLARFLENGFLEYIGRSDRQIKIDGHRIELREIEEHLLEYEYVDNATVIAQEDDLRGRYICAYIAPKEGFSQAQARTYLCSFLPHYMIPKFFLILDSIPLTQNGKVDEKSLPKPVASSEGWQEYVAPRNDREKALIKVIPELLRIKRLSVKENFISLGGDSIKAIQIASKLKDMGYMIKTKDILAHPVIEEMATYMEVDEQISYTGRACEGDIPNIPIVSWFFTRGFASVNYYNQSVMIQLKKDISVEDIETVINAIIRHHDSLRINYSVEKGCLYYNDRYLREVFPVKEHDLSAHDYERQCLEMKRIGGIMKSGFDIERSILFKACLFNLGQEGKRLLLTAHHLVIDGVSWMIILDDLYKGLHMMEKDKDILLPRKTHSLKLWAEEINKEAAVAKALKESVYWNSVDNRIFRMPTDYHSGIDYMKDCQIITEEMREEDTRKLFSSANTPYNTQAVQLMIAALSSTLSRYAHSRTVLLELEGHGREELAKLDLSRTVGWFTTIYPVALDVDNEISQHIKGIKEQLRQTPGNGVNYGTLRYLVKAIHCDEQRRVRFNYLGDFTTSFTNDLFGFAPEDSGPEYAPDNHFTSLLEVNALAVNSRLRIMLTYSQNKFKETTAKKLLQEFIEDLQKIIFYCCSKEEIEFTPGDFDTLELTPTDIDLLFHN